MAKTKFYRLMTSLCEAADVSIAHVFAVTTDLDPGAAIKKMKNGWIPDDTVLEQLAAYFGVDETVFTELEPSLCYLAVPITNNPNFVADSQAAKAYLESKGEHVIAPGLIDTLLPKNHMTRSQFMGLGIAYLNICEKLAVMPGWETSLGCRMEMAYAEATGKEIIYLTDEYKKAVPVSMEMNVGYLKTLIKDLPDEMPVFVSAREQSNFDFGTNAPCKGTDTFAIVHNGKLFITDECCVGPDSDGNSI